MLSGSWVRFPVAFTAHQHPNLPRAALYHSFGISIRVYARCQGIEESYEKQICFPRSHQKFCFLRFSSERCRLILMHLTFNAQNMHCGFSLSSIFAIRRGKKWRQTCFGQHFSRPSLPMGFFRCRYSWMDASAVKCGLFDSYVPLFVFVLPVKMCNG